MKRFVTLSVLSLALVATTASAALRSPQVPVFGGGLQGYLNSVGESINVTTDQNSAQRWVSTVSTNSVFTIQVELGTDAASNTLGLYNAAAASPSLYQVFPGAATAGWFAVASFRSSPTRVVVNLFDDNATSQGSTVYLGADRNDFGFYISGPNGTWYTQDSRNSNNAQALTFAGTGINSGQWWLCFEDTALDGSTQDYDDAVLFLESVNPTPVSKSSWGDLKRRFR
jgi:hypothetical protein